MTRQMRRFRDRQAQKKREKKVTAQRERERERHHSQGWFARTSRSGHTLLRAKDVSRLKRPDSRARRSLIGFRYGWKVYHDQEINE